MRGECEMAKKRPKIATGGRGRYSEQVTYWYQGRADVHRQVPGKPWWGTSETVECPHRHADPDAAKRCGERLGHRRAREINRDLTETYTARACDYQAGDTRHFESDDPLFIKFCAAHDTAAFSPWPCKPTAAEA